jgi:hypothetical protein
MADKMSRISAIVEVMRDSWDLPADCNEGELFTYAERLDDRIAAGDSQDKLYAYLSGCRPTSWTWPSRTISGGSSIARSNLQGVPTERRSRYAAPHSEARIRRRVRTTASPARPKSIMAQVAGSGTTPLSETISSVKLSAVAPLPQLHT